MNENHDKLREAALEMAREVGLLNVTRRGICKRAGVPYGSFTYVTGQTFADFMGEVRHLADPTDRPDLANVSVKRMHPTLRQEQLLGIALEMAREADYREVTRDGLAQRAGVAHGLVSRYFGTMGQLRRAIMRAAVHQGVVEVVAQGLVAGDEQARKAPAALMHMARDHMVKLCQEGQ